MSDKLFEVLGAIGSGILIGFVALGIILGVSQTVGIFSNTNKTDSSAKPPTTIPTDTVSPPDVTVNEPDPVPPPVETPAEPEAHGEELIVGAQCRDGSQSQATGRGACSHHDGVDYWLTN